eukprot:1754279-Rhodomonas_salina.2
MLSVDTPSIATCSSKVHRRSVATYSSAVPLGQEQPTAAQYLPGQYLPMYRAQDTLVPGSEILRRLPEHVTLSRHVLFDVDT